MKTYNLWIFHADKDYGLKGFWYIDDSKFFSYGYSPSFLGAVLNWLKHLPNAYALRRMVASVDKKSKEEARNHNAR